MQKHRMLNWALPCAVLAMHATALAQQPDCIKQGESLFAQKNYKETVRTLQRCTEDPASWRLLGLTYFKLNYMDDAKEYLRKAIERDPSDEALQATYADAFALNREFSKAVDEFKKLREKFPASMEIKKGLAQALGWSKRYDESIALYRELVKQDPADVESRIQIAVLMSWNKRFADAVTELRAIIQSKPSREWELQARLKLAEVISWQKKLDESIREYDAAIAFAPDAVDAYLGKGIVLEWKAEYKEARKQYEKALQVDSQSTAAKAHLQQLLWVK